MACAKTGHYNHLVSWNIKGEGAAQDRKNTVSAYLSALRPSADILFLQEVQWAPSNLRTHLSALSDHHDLTQYSQEYANCYNCVIFDKRKFEALPGELQTPLNDCFKLLDKWNEWEKGGFRGSQEKQMRNRMCVVVLLDKKEGCKFIAASLHNLNNKEYSMKMAELFLLLLSMVGETTGHPIVLAGDFNANVQKSSEVARLGFTVPEYKPTLHRLNRKSPIDVTIDFFLSRGGAVLLSIKADLARSDVVDSKGIIDNKKMDALHKVSNHDPLRATLQFSRRSTKVMPRPSAAAAATSSKRPSSSSSKPVKSSVKMSPSVPPAIIRPPAKPIQPSPVKSSASQRAVKSTAPVSKIVSTTSPQPKPAPSKPASSRAQAKPSTVRCSTGSKKVPESRASNSAKTKHSTVTRK